MLDFPAIFTANHLPSSEVQARDVDLQVAWKLQAKKCLARHCYTPGSLTVRTRKMGLGRLPSLWDGLFSGTMLVSGMCGNPEGNAI